MFAFKRASANLATRRAAATMKRSMSSSSSANLEGLAKKWVPPAVVVLGGLALVLPRNGTMEKSSEERVAMKMGWDDFTSKALTMTDDDEDEDEEEDEDDEDAEDEEDE